MIRKPTEKDFKESTAVTVARESKRTAVEASIGIGRGFQSVARMWAKGIYWFAILATAIPAILSGRIEGGLFLIVFGFGLSFVLSNGLSFLAEIGRDKDAPPRGRPAPKDLLLAAQQQISHHTQPVKKAGATQSLILSSPIAARQVMVLSIPGAILIFIGKSTIIAQIPGLFMITIAALIVFKSVVDRKIVDFDHQSITVNNLLYKNTMAWSNVEDITARPHSWLNLKVLFMTGGRRSIVISGYSDKGNFTELLIPIDLLDLDRKGLELLIAEFIARRAFADVVAPDETKFTQARHGSTHDSFDPNAITARYLAERAQIVEEVRPDLANGPIAPAQFGRKTFGRRAA
jgi:uncharacterized membrane protein YphA (DoxX/SURF4 family)